jgi:antitoxin component YwqK of YwqJK toxin-antitoxin module
VKEGNSMEMANTKYGLFKDITFSDYYSNGNLMRCVLKQRNAVSVPCGTFIPQYVDDGKRKILTKSMTFHENGNLSSLVLQETTLVNTSLGRLPAEMITFYENGAVKRIFPSFGIVNAFWTEKDEHRVSPELEIKLPFGKFSGKVINLTLFETGELKSITLWPDDTISVHTPSGEIPTRIGFCLYPDGQIKSVEPAVLIHVSTPIGNVPAFDPDALGIDGDYNSLVFEKDGSVSSLLTHTAQITVIRGGEVPVVHAPTFGGSDYFDDKKAVVPMKIRFANGYVSFGNRKTKSTDARYKISECSFQIEYLDVKDCHNICNDCFE